MSKHKLIILVGMSPAVITETVYALWKNKDIPDEVIAVTTKAGQKEIKSQLIDSGIWKQMLNELDLEGKIKFGLNSQNIRLIPDVCRESDSSDIATTDDNNEMADFLLTELRKYTENPEVEKISFSIAGGRKSMSAVGALVMTLLGRCNDHLYHILVNSPYDNPNLEPRFYYPQKNKTHYLGDKKFAGGTAFLQLGEIPFVRCRYWFEEKNIKIMNYSTLVSSINKNRVKIRIDSSLQRLYINDRLISLSYLEFLLFWMFAERYTDEITELFSSIKELEKEFRFFLKDKKIATVSGSLGRGNIAANCIYESQITDNLAKKISAMKQKIKEQCFDLSDDDIMALSLTDFTQRGKYGFNKSFGYKRDIEIL